MAKQVFFVLILVFFVSLPSFGEVKSDSIIIVKVNWQAGDSAFYRFTQTSNSLLLGKTIAHLKKSNELKFVVKEKTDSGYLLNLTFGKTWFDQSDSLSKVEIFNSLLKEKMSGINLTYFVNTQGAFVRWINLGSFKESISVLFDSIASDDFLKFNAEFQPLVAILKNEYQSEKRIKEEFLTPIKWFHYFYGAKLKLNQKESIDDEFVDFEFGIPVPALTQAQTEYSNNTSGNILISGNTLVNDFAYTNWLKSFKEETLASKKRDDAHEIISSTKNYDHKLTFNYKIDAKSGWVKQLSQRETISNYKSKTAGMIEFTFLK